MLIKGYSDFSITRAGINSSFEPMASYGIYFKLDNDISLLFPYVNSGIDDARFFNNPEFVRFTYEGVRCTVYPTEVIAVPFNGEKQARLFITKLIRLFNGFHDRKSTLAPDYKKYKTVSVIDLYTLLPGTNCKECGFLTCLAFAAHLSVSETSPCHCPYFCKPISRNAIYPVYDRDGNLTSTVTIETGFEERDHAELRNKSKVALKVSSSGVKAELTKREHEVICLVARGATNTEISEKLFISPHTVKSHVIHIFNKLGVNDRTQAAVWAAKNNIV